MPWSGPFFEIDSVKEAKKKNIFIGDYKVNIVEVFDSTYQLPNFKNIILVGTLVYERNKFGIVRKVLGSNYNVLIFILDDKNNKQFLTDDYSKTWTIEDGSDKFSGLYGKINFIYKCVDVNEYTIKYKRYTIYLKTNPMSIKEETLIPVLNFELVPKE